ncbi:MAG: B-box zinc finger protein [Bryobacteraceae bacterium]
MNCVQHPDVAAVAYCRACGRPLCTECKRAWQGVVYCDGHLPAGAAAAPPPPSTTTTQAQPGAANPGLAFVLGLIPGVGAIYNGQYGKGLIHALIFGLLISLVNSDHVSGGLEPLFGFMIPVFVFYMAFEAYHTARRRTVGEPVDELSSIVNLNSMPSSGNTGAIVLIVLGIIFLLNTLEVLRMRQILRFWPVLLIALGAQMLYSRISGTGTGPGEPPARESSLGAHHERQ